MYDDDNLEGRLATLFEEVRDAHSEAYRDKEGADPDWPIWYAEYLQDELSRVLDASLTKSDLVYLLITADRERSSEAPGSRWPAYYAGFFATRYG